MPRGVFCAVRANWDCSAVWYGAILKNSLPKVLYIVIQLRYNMLMNAVEGYERITKALQDLAKAVESNETVKSVKVTITMQKPKPSKAKPKSR